MSYANLDGVPSQSEGVSEVLASDWNTYVRDNFDSLKAGHIVCTSSTRPSPLGAGDKGLMIFETDTNQVLVYNGSSWFAVHDLDNNAGLPTTITTANIADGAVNETKISLPRCEVRRSSLLGVTSGAAVTWDAANWDTDGSMWSAGSPTYITITQAGLYHIYAMVTFQSGTTPPNAGYIARLWTESSGNATFWTYQPGGTPTSNDSITVSGVQRMNVGDTVTLRFAFSSPATIYLSGHPTTYYALQSRMGVACIGDY